MSRRVCAAGVFGLMTLLTFPVSAQISDYGFSQTQCGAADPLFRAGLEPAERADTRPSGGGGGEFPGNVSLQVIVPDTERSHRAYIQVPQAYSPHLAWPVILLLQGAAGSAAAADAQAQSLRAYWQAVAEQFGALIVVPVASGNSGGWVPSLDTPALACVLAEVERRYSIDRRRRYLWGFSAGAHYGHALALANAERFAAYSVKAGALASVVCTSSGGPSACATTLPQVQRRIPLQLRVGENDPLRPYTTADAVAFANAGWTTGINLSASIVAGGHELLADDAVEAARWFAGFQLP